MRRRDNAKRTLDVIIRLAVLAAVMLGADMLALMLFLAGCQGAPIAAVLIAGALAGYALGRRAVTPAKIGGSFPGPAPARHKSAPKKR